MGPTDKPNADEREPVAGQARRASTPAAERALAEAEARRRAIDQVADGQPPEINGRGGADPVRFGDWEVKGIATDF